MKNISILRYFFAAIILAAPASAISQGFNYDYIEGSYGSITIDTGIGDVDGTGFAFSGSFSISENLAFGAGFSTESYDTFLGIDVDADSTVMGLAGHLSSGPKTDVIVGFSILNADIEESDGFTTISDSDSGTIITLGFRNMASDTLELAASFSSTDIFDDTSNQTAFGLRFYSSEKMSLGAGYATGDDVDVLLFDIRVGL